MVYNQIAENPNLVGWFHRETKVDHQYKTVVIEETPHWEYVYIPGLEHSKGEHPDHIDYNRIPQSLHYDSGMKITWGWMKFQAGYRQSISVQAGQRYTAVAKFEGDIHETQDPNAVQWMFFADGLQSAHSEWSAYMSASQFGVAAEHQFVFQANTNGWVELTFWTKAEWPESAGEMRVKSIEVFEVPNDYGEALPVVVFPHDEQHPPGPSPDPPDLPDPEPDTPSAPGWLLPLFVGVIGVIIGAIVYSFIQPRLAVQGVQFMQPDQSLVDIYTVLANIPMFAAIAFGLPVVYYLMEIWKRLIDPNIPMPPQDQVWGKLLGFFIKPSPVALFIVLVMMMSGAYYLAGTLGEGESFKQVTQFLVDLINAIGQWAFPTLVIQVVGSRGYDHFRSQKVLGFNAPAVKRERAA